MSTTRDDVHGRPRLSRTDVRRVEEELARTSAEIAALPRPALDALAPVLAQAQREVTRDLRTWLTSANGDARYTTQVHRTVLAHLESAFTAIERLDPTMLGGLSLASAAAGHLAGRHLISEVARYSAQFEGTALHLPLDLARIVAVGERELIPQHRASAARYAGQVGQDIRRELAVGMIRRETVGELTSRMQRLGGPRGEVALRGVAGDPGAVVEQIGEGLFRRYRWWAERIVRTETQRAYNVQLDAGLRQARQHMPDLVRRWDSSLDLRLCPQCQQLHGQTAPIGGAFPGGITDAPAHPCCRCRVGAWRPEWSDILAEAGGETPTANASLATGTEVGAEGSRRTPDTDHVGLTSCREHPAAPRLLNEARARGFEPTTNNNLEANVELVELVHDDGRREIRRRLNYDPRMRLIDLEHELGHIDQLQRIGAPPPFTERLRVRRDGLVTPHSDRKQVLTNAADAAVEYHNRIVELRRLIMRGAPSEVIEVHEQGCRAAKEHERNTTRRGGSRWVRLWIRDRLPDYDEQVQWFSEWCKLGR